MLTVGVGAGRYVSAMARALLALLLLVVVLAGGSLAGGVLAARAAPLRADYVPFRIDQTSIGRAPLGKTVAFYRSAHGSRGVRVFKSGGFDRLILDDWHVEVLFRPGGKTAVGLITWAARVETALGVGACSRTPKLLAAYGPKLERVAAGKTLTAYRLGRLVFVAGSAGFVHSVGLLLPGIPITPVLTAPVCGVPSVV